MQLSQLNNALSKLFRSSFLGAQETPASSGGAPARSASVNSWEDDARWGREHWRVRREAVEWPNKERVAAVLAIPFGFPDYSYKVPQGGGTTGKVARMHVQVYGPKFGIWRLFDLLERHNLKASFQICGMTAAQFPDEVKEVSRRGHEIVGFNWADNVFHDQLKVDEDRRLIQRTLAEIERVTGRRPTGWVAPGLRFGAKTLEYLAQEGINWHACNLSDDRPYVIHAATKKMVVMPHADQQMDDTGFIIGSRRPPEVFVDFLTRQFRTLYREGEEPLGKMFNFSVHPEYGARPFFIDAIEEVIVHLKSFPDVWMTTRQNIAEYWLSKNYS